LAALFRLRTSIVDRAIHRAQTGEWEGNETKKTDLIVITGAGAFIGRNLVKHLRAGGFSRIRAVDEKPLNEWYLLFSEVENLCLDCSDEEPCKRVCDGATEVYNLAADMGGMGFIERLPRGVSAKHPN
jgi:nucleoside-diphosphate-sugar epimerase